MIRHWFKAFVFFAAASGQIFAYSGEIYDPATVGIIVNQQQKKPKTKEEAMRILQAYLLESIMLKPMFEGETSLLTEEEREELGAFADTSLQNQLIIRELSDRLAEEDVLGLNTQLTRRGGASASRMRVDTARASSFVIGKVPR